MKADNEIREHPKCCAVCLELENLKQDTCYLHAGGEKHLFIVYRCEKHLDTTDEEIQEIISKDIDLIRF